MEWNTDLKKCTEGCVLITYQYSRDVNDREVIQAVCMKSPTLYFDSIKQGMSLNQDRIIAWMELPEPCRDKLNKT